MANAGYNMTQAQGAAERVSAMTPEKAGLIYAVLAAGEIVAAGLGEVAASVSGLRPVLTDMLAENRHARGDPRRDRRRRREGLAAAGAKGSR